MTIYTNPLSFIGFTAVYKLVLGRLINSFIFIIIVSGQATSYLKLMSGYMAKYKTNF